MASIAFTIVQLAATLLTLLTENPQLPAATKGQALAVLDQAATTAVWALSRRETDAAVDVDANVEKLQGALYLTESGVRVPLGTKAPITQGVMALLEEYVSFGYLDADGLTDAMVIVETSYPDGKIAHHLAVIRNFGGALANTLREPLPELEAIYDHRIVDGGLYLDYKPKGAERTTTRFTVHPQFAGAPPFVILRNPEPLPYAERAGTAGNKIASFLVFAAPWGGGATVRSVTLDKDYDHGIRLANLRVAGSAAVHTTVSDTESEISFPLFLTVPAGEMRTIDVYADVAGGEAGTHTNVIDLIRGEAVNGKGDALAWPAPLEGQTVTVR